MLLYIQFMNKSNSHGIKYVLYLWALAIYWIERKIFSVVVANAARQTVFRYVRTINGDSGCECSQKDRV